MRLAVIGLGQRIAHVLCACRDAGWRFNLAGYADPAPVGLPVLAEAGIQTGSAYASAQSLLADGPFDLVLVGSPNHLHLDHLLTAFEAGFPIFCEKPIVRTQDETFTLARRLAKGSTPPLYVGLVMRSMPIVREVVARIDAGELGTIVSMDATEHLHPEHGAYLARNWRRKQKWGGSYMLDKVCHDFDIFHRLAGARPARVASFGGRGIFRPQREHLRRADDDGKPAYALHDAGWAAANDAFQSDMDVTDHQTAIVEYANGFQVSFHSNTHVSLQERRWYIAGTKATLIADLVRNRILMRGTLDQGKPEQLELGNRTTDLHNGADQAMAADLLATLQGHQKFPVTPDDSMVAGLTVMAIDEAMQEGRVVDCAGIWQRYDEACAGGAVSARI
jgi:predicted dehydrogenase